MKIVKITTVEQDCDFSGLTLLSKEEYVKRKDRIKPIESWWWLSSPGGISFRAASAYGGGNVNISGGTVNYSNNAVRPALRIRNLKSLIVGDEFVFNDKRWTVISEKYALCDEEFCRMAFRKDWRANDANDYEQSDIKRYLDAEWKRIKEAIDRIDPNGNYEPSNCSWVDMVAQNNNKAKMDKECEVK